jgi:Phage-related minor tail protein
VEVSPIALLVGEIMARISADRSGFTRETKAAEAEHKALLQKVDGQKAKIDADTSAVDSKLKDVGDAAKSAGQEMNVAFSTAWKSIAADLDRTEAGARASFAGVADAAENAGDQVAARFGGKVEAGLASVMRSAGALGVGAFIGQQLMAGLEQEWEEDRVGGLIEAQTGAAAGSAGRLGETAGNMFRNHFGESIEDVGRALTAVFQNDLIDESAAVADIEKITGKVMTASDVIEEEFAAVGRAAQQAVRTDLAGNVSEALDMITHATQEGLNTSGDLLDTITEYGTSFRELGLDGAESLGLIGQAQRAGARDTDYAADALKEFAILAQDTASTASRGFQTLGLDGEKMGRMIAAGGVPARDALRQTLNALRDMPPGIERNSAAVDLFGTKAEDLGDALFSMDLDTAAASFGDFAGATDEAGKALEDAVPPLERFHQGMMRMLDDVAGGIAGLNDTMESVPEGMQGFEGLDLFSPDEVEQVDKGAEALDNVADSAEGAADANVRLGETVDQLLDKQRAAADGVISLSEAQIRNQQATADAQQAMEDFAGEGVNKAKTAFDLTTEAGQEMRGALNDVAKSTMDTIGAMREQNATSAEVAEYMKAQRVTFIELATGMGLSETAATALADALIGIPDKVVPQVGIQDAASPAIAAIKRRLDAMPKSVRTDYYLYTHYRSQGASRPEHLSPGWQGVGGLAEGGVLEFFASGGLRPMSASTADIVQSHSRTGFMRVIADNPIADEAFIPIIPTSTRAQAILDETIKRMRPNLAEFAGVVPMADGGIYGKYGKPVPGGTVNVREGHNIVVNGPDDPRQLVRMVIEELDTREALRGY